MKRTLLGHKSYLDKVLSLSPIAYWPLFEGSGTIADNAESMAARDGAYSGVVLGQIGIGDGLTAPLFDGVNDYANIYSASLASVFNGQEYTAAAWVRVFDASVLTDATVRYYIYTGVDANNRMLLRKSATNNTITMLYFAGGTAKTVTITSSSIGWIHLATTISKSTDEMKGYLNGVQLGGTQTALGAYVGTLASNNVFIGAASITPTSVWNGYIAHVALWNTALSATQIASLSSLVV